MNCYTIRRVRSSTELLEVWNVIEQQIHQFIADPEDHILDLQRHFPLNKHLMLLLEHEDGIVGGALGFGSTLRALGILPEHRGRGLGRLLVQIFEFSAIKTGLTMISAGTVDESKGFYTRLG